MKQNSPPIASTHLATPEKTVAGCKYNSYAGAVFTSSTANRRAASGKGGGSHDRCPHDCGFGYHTCQNRLGGDPEIIGKVIRVNAESLKVTGVSPGDPPGTQNDGGDEHKCEWLAAVVPARHAGRVDPARALQIGVNSST